MGNDKIWFITGTSRGFGRVWARAALERGDRVAATARDVSSLDDLVAAHGDAILPISLDVTDPAAAQAAIEAAHARFGRIDVIANNAGYGLFGAVEEVSPAQARAQLETNLLGPLWVVRAALPMLRTQGHGRILQVSSIGGVAAFPLLGLYHASKWGLEAWSESLAQELAGTGVRVTIVEPGPYGTDWNGASAVTAAPRPDYDRFREARRAAATAHEPVDPAVTAPVILALADHPDPPLRLFLGSYPYPIAERVYAERLETWRAGRDLAERATTSHS